METKYIDTPEWDKTFALSDKVNHKKVSFTNRYGIRLVGDLYTPKNPAGKLPAIAVCGPYGAVKEQASGLYAQTLAERGFITLAFDPSFSGESGGQPRYISSGEIYTEDYSAAVDFFLLQPEVDRERIGILGICGFGGISINAAVQDTRIKATVSSTMGAFDPYDKEQRYEMRRQLNEQRTADLLAGRINERSGGVPANLPDDAPGFMKDYRDYYKTTRGFHPRSVNSNGGWEKIADLPFLTFSLLDHADEIRSAVLVMHGEKAYSLPASQEAFGKLKGDNKELLIIPDASHTDLYDRTDIIPFDKIEAFFRKYLR
ncbi:MAG: alpha/beta hydrolase [Bacteroidetes bacterium]|uniref:Alpha/beta hydrolase n=1 Tax=Candidatus Pullibacteroides excrementavium TaxID=2840905 RepID=A0A9D9DY16_9BACT|nr:alpha/beta hydrolase [Candidatus Pullibacteroides excrementavium]